MAVESPPGPPPTTTARRGFGGVPEVEVDEGDADADADADARLDRCIVEWVFFSCSLLFCRLAFSISLAENGSRNPWMRKRERLE